MTWHRKFGNVTAGRAMAGKLRFRNQASVKRDQNCRKFLTCHAAKAAESHKDRHVKAMQQRVSDHLTIGQ
jgi:hypothetical protein